MEQRAKGGFERKAQSARRKALESGRCIKFAMQVRTGKSAVTKTV
jgi:hypothetical protein